MSIGTGSSLADLAAADAPIIACDLDDVLSETNRAVAQCMQSGVHSALTLHLTAPITVGHNDTYNTSMDLSMFLYYYYWRNPYWGTPDETTRKVNEFYETTRLDEALPISGALEGVEKLKKLGFKLVVVTARQGRQRERSLNWLERHFPGVFETMICTGQSQETIFDHSPQSSAKLTKAGVCKEINARILIDDSAENAFACAKAAHPITTLLFGDYEWNKRRGKLNEAEELSYEEKTKQEGDREWWKDDDVEVPQDGTPLYRAKNWEEVVAFVEKAKSQGQI